jgi:hypothetical protein
MHVRKSPTKYNLIYANKPQNSSLKKGHTKTIDGLTLASEPWFVDPPWRSLSPNNLHQNHLGS